MDSADATFVDLPWAGDLSDDCHFRLGSWLAHCECLGELSVRGASERRGFPSEYWFVGVYDEHPANPQTLFHSDEHAGFIINGEMARAIAATVFWQSIRATLGPVATGILRALSVPGVHTLPEIAEQMKGDRNLVRVTAGRLCDRQLIIRESRGCYALPRQ